MIVHGKAQLDRMVADGALSVETAHEIDKFAAFLRNVGARDCTCEKGVRDESGEIIAHAHLDVATYAYATGQDIDPTGTGEPW